MNAKKERIKSKINLCIMYGGPGGEHEVSIKSAENIISNIDKNKYNLKIIFLKKSQNKINVKDLKLLRQEKYIVWPIFHGEFGEGGKLQKILEKNKIKFIGCKSKSAELAMDKFKTQKVLIKNGIFVPKSQILNIKSFSKFVTSEFFLKNFNYPLILKPLNGGSSVDLHKVKDKNSLDKSLKNIFKNNKQILLQEFVVGREFTCGVLQVGKRNMALLASEIILTKSDVFNYEVKYSVGGCQEITPAKVDKNLMIKIQKLATRVHELIGCKDISRTDMILNNKNQLIVLEINTMPGMTKTSFIPQQLFAKTILTSRFIDILVTNNL